MNDAVPNRAAVPSIVLACGFHANAFAQLPEANSHLATMSVRDAFIVSWFGWLHTSEAVSKIEVCQSSCATSLNPADDDERSFHY